MKKFSVLLIFILFGCTEPYLLQTTDFEEAIVIEATITNELKTQTIKLSKTYKLEENGPEFIENANVSVSDDLGNVYNFIEGNEIYESENPFQALPGRKYKLTIQTNGKTYTSSQEVLTNSNPIQDVVVTDQTNGGERGAAINVKAFDPTNSSKYYRYEYEETYKIIAPKWLPHTAKVAQPGDTLIFTPRTYEARVCYSTDISNKIILQSTTNLTEDRVDYMVRFIPVNNPIIAHRYSILAKQYVQNLEAFTYYSTLKKLSENQSVLSSNQPGFFSGNIICENNSNEKVIGFFDVSNYSEKRIFFNFEDVFPNTPKPGYFYDCFNEQADLSNLHAKGRFKYCFEGPPSSCKGETVRQYLDYQGLLYYQNSYIESKQYVDLIPPPCGDCTTFSSNVVPPFWY
jgi:hypothetical protein